VFVVCCVGSGLRQTDHLFIGFLPCLCVCGCLIVCDLYIFKKNKFRSQYSFLKLTPTTCFCTRSATLPVTSSIHPTTANCNLVTIATDCTRSHPTEFPITVSTRHCSRDGGNFKSKITGLSEKTDRQKIVLHLLAVLLVAYRAAHRNQHSDVFVCAIIVCKLHLPWLFLCLSLWNGEESNFFLRGSQFQN